MSQLFAGLGSSVHSDTAVAIAEAVAQARPALHGHAPSVAFVTATVEHDAQQVFAALLAACPGWRCTASLPRSACSGPPGW